MSTAEQHSKTSEVCLYFFFVCFVIILVGIGLGAFFTYHVDAPEPKPGGGGHGMILPMDGEYAPHAGIWRES